MAHGPSDPPQFSFLGTDVDFGKNGLIVEAQFSNYPFLLNNTIRSELFFKAKLNLSGIPTLATVILTKGHMFPASNSTLYYEQARNQLNALATNRVFDSPIRLVGLFAPRIGTLPVIWTEYAATRYSRTVRTRMTRQCTVGAGRNASSRCRMTLA